MRKKIAAIIFAAVAMVTLFTTKVFAITDPIDIFWWLRR